MIFMVSRLVRSVLKLRTAGMEANKWRIPLLSGFCESLRESYLTEELEMEPASMLTSMLNSHYLLAQTRVAKPVQPALILQHSDESKQDAKRWLLHEEWRDTCIRITIRPDYNALHRCERDADPWTVLLGQHVERNALLRPKAPPRSVNATSEDQSQSGLH